MKKMLLAATLLAGSFGSAFGQCPAPEVTPWTDDVESMTVSASFTSENCWSTTSAGGYDWNVGTGTTTSSNTGPSGANSGANYFYVEASSGSAGAVSTLESPQVDLTGLTVPTLEFNYHMYGSAINQLEIQAWDGTSWVTLDQIIGQQHAASADAWSLRTVYLTGITGVTQFRFNATRGGSFEGDISLDDISVLESTATCPPPSLLNASMFTPTSLDLGWTENGSAMLWNIEYGAAGFAPTGTPTITGSNTNPTTINGTTPNTSYDFYVQADCGGGDLSAWVGPFNVLTPCVPLATPWIDGVESMTVGSLINENCWEDLSAGAYKWFAHSGGTASGSTGPNGANGGNKYFYTESSNGAQGDQAIMLSPELDLSGITTTPVLEYYVHMYGATMGDLTVEAWDGTTWNTVDNIIGQQQTAEADAYILRTAYLVGYTGTTQLRFTGTKGSSFTGDIAIDDIQIYASPSCPAPVDLSLQDADASSASFNWVSAPIGTETEWQLMYGPVGFTPPAGTGMLTTQNPDTLTGLTSNEFYEVYVQAVCGAGDSSAWYGPVVFNTYNQPAFMEFDTDCPAGGFIDIAGIGTDLGLTDDGEVALDPLPFPVLFQGQLMTNMTVGNNGGLQLGTTTANIGYGGNFGTLGDGTMFPWGDDLDDETGDVWAGVTGTAPNRILVIQWDNSNNWSNGTGTVTFQIQIEEATGEIYYVYDDAVFGGAESGDDYGANADIGISGPNQDITVSSNDPQYLMDNSCAHFYYTDCPKPSNFNVISVDTSEVSFTWSAGLAGETEWTVIYGPAGFDPATGGTSLNSLAPAMIIPGLDDITCYDVYIYADCDPGNVQSNGFMGSFCTLPVCSDPTAVATATALDSVFTDWNWVESAASHPQTGFNLQYGMNGFNLYDGNHTIVNADTNFSDTTFDAGFLAGGVYQMYVQAVCDTDTSNWVGPVTFTMPLSNDSVCGSEHLQVDGTVYYFDNSGAGIDPGETAIAPPATGFQTTTGWGNQNMSFTTWYTFDAPASGQIRFDATDEGFDGQFAVYEVTDCSDFGTFTLLGANDNSMLGGTSAPNFTICGLTPGNTYYLLHDSYSTTTQDVFSVKMTEVVVNAGSTNGILDICTGDSVDLYTGIAGFDAGGYWYEEIPTINFADPIFPSAGLAYQVFDFGYVVVDGCARDTVMQQVQIYGPSSAGTDGQINVCRNQPVNLLSGLSGNIDTGGQWYDPSNNPTDDDIVASNIPGQFNYDYIAGNGVCPNDTANVIVVVDANCDYLNIEDLHFGNVELYPNPTSGSVFVANYGSADVFNYEVTDVNGKLIATVENAINGTDVTEIKLGGLERGIYLIKVYNGDAEKTFRVVKQ